MEATINELNDLVQRGIITKYAIGGAMAAVFYLEPISTFDLDVFVLLPPQVELLVTLEPLYSELRSRGFSEHSECVLIHGVPVQFLPAYNALVQEAVENALETRYGATRAVVCTPEYLMAIMLQTGRPKDRHRYSMFLSQNIFDHAKLEKIVASFDLYDRFLLWNNDRNQ